MRALPLALGAFLATAGAASAQTVEIEDAVAKVTVITEARSDIAVEVQQGASGLPAIEVSRRGDKIFIDGGLSDRRIRSCFGRGEGANERFTVEVSGVGQVPLESAPRIIIRAPMTVDIKADGAVWGSVGRTQSLELANAGCGDWTVANVAGKLDLDIAGSGDTRVGTVGSAEISVAGSGDTTLVSVADGLSVNIAGSGNVRAGRSDGRFVATIAGSGDVIVDGGRTEGVKARIAGSGDVRFAGVANAVSAQIAGSGDVRVAQVNGPVDRAVVGSGDVIIGR